MFIKKQLIKWTKFFMAPYLDYHARHRAQLAKRWPLFIERDRKKIFAFTNYGTTFRNSR